MRTIKDKTFDKYIQLLNKKSHTWEQSEINALCKLLNMLGWHSGDWHQSEESKAEAKRSLELYNKLHTAISDAMERFGGFKITTKQSDFGKDWLKSRVLKKRGGIRANCGFHYGHEDAIRQIKGFRFAGIMVGRNGYQQPIQHTPIYRILTRDSTFSQGLDYAAIYWGNTYVEENIEERIGA